MEIQQLELDLWQALEIASRFPETADVRSLCQALEQTLAEQSLADQLAVAGDVFVRLSEVYAARSDLLMSRWEHQHQPTEPVVTLDNCIELFVQSLSLDVTELFAEPESMQYPANRQQTLSRQEDGSVVGDVDKDTLLSWIDQTVGEPPLNALEMAAQLRDLAYGETVEEWSQAIAQYLRQFPSTIRISDLQQALAMPLVELWLGLLIGGYSLTQHGEFYDNQTLWIMNHDGEV